MNFLDWIICLKKSIDGEKSRASSFKVSRNYLSRIDSPKTDSERRQSEIYFEDNKVNMKIVMEESEYASVSNNERINVSDLASGIYIVKVTENGISETRKIAIK